MNKLSFTRFSPLTYANQEAFNTLCTNITFAGSNMRKVMVTSCHASEGKTYVSMNILRSMAQLGYNVVLVDCDLRRSQIKSRYGVQISSGSGNGLSHYLSGQCSIEDILYETNIPGAYYVPIGHEVKNSLALLQDERLKTCMDQLAKVFDYVIVDAPPVGVIIDAATIATACNGTLIVVKYNSVASKELIAVKEQIERSGSEVLGTVLNDVSFESLSSKKYYNKYGNSYYSSNYYLPSNDKKPSKRKHRRGDDE